jgi:hypothetical protein
MTANSAVRQNYNVFGAAMPPQIVTWDGTTEGKRLTHRPA